VSARGSEGNTLLEIAAVLGILGVLVTLTLSGFTQVRQDRLAEGVAWEVAQTLRHAQQLAVARSGEWRAVRVRFSDRVEVRGVWPDGAETEVVAATDRFPRGVRVIPLSRPLIQFSRSGSPTPGSNQTIEVGAGSAVRYVVLSGQTGRVRITRTRP
jgi:type II secretory pathway pseudopilin PulG